ncbi:MAG: tetratricopeptide repeat protein [Bacteriovoracia bacterium]
MAIRRPASALLSKYLEQYRRQPGSRVFAPLAESYRKLGMIDEALKVLKEGIKRHPGYVLGYLVLANCYHDQRKNDAAYQTLLPLTSQNRDNPGLQKLFAQVCLELGNLDEALETFKYLLFLNPRDKYYAQQVKTLEDDLQKNTLIRPQSVVLKAPQPIQPFATDENDWSMVDFSSANELSSENPSSDEDQWSMQAPPTAEPTASISKEDDWQVMSRSIDDDYFSDEEVTPEDADAPIHEDSAPIASHTLVDLYLAQNHVEPAIDLLESFVRLNPRDERSVKRLAELRGKLVEESTTQAREEVTQDGHDELMRIIEAQVHAPDTAKIERVYRLFLQQIQLTADENMNHG